MGRLFVILENPVNSSGIVASLAVIIAVLVFVMLGGVAAFFLLRRRKRGGESERTPPTAEVIAGYFDDPSLAPLTPHHPATTALQVPITGPSQVAIEEKLTELDNLLTVEKISVAEHVAARAAVLSGGCALQNRLPTT